MSSNFQKVCAFCEESFPIEEIKDHIAINHLGTEPQPIEESIHQEIKEELQANLTNNRCTFCDIGFPNKTTLKIHLKNFHQIKQTLPKRPILPCDICGKEFSENRYLRIHKLTVHEGKKRKREPQDCELCGQKLASMKGLHEHIKRRHGGLQYPCELCENSYSTQKGLLEHKERVHEEQPKSSDDFSCDICMKDFYDRTKLRKHKKSVHESEPQTCDLCSKTFTSSSYLRSHKKNVHDGLQIKTKKSAETVECEHCGKYYSNKYYLQRHACRATENEMEPLVCIECPEPKVFSSNRGLLVHQRNFHKEYMITAL